MCGFGREPNAVVMKIKGHKVNACNVQRRGRKTKIANQIHNNIKPWKR